MQKKESAKEKNDKHIATLETHSKHIMVICEYFANGMQKAKAYQSVYPDVSDKSASTSFSRLLDNIEFKVEFDHRMKQHVTAAGLTTSYIIDEMKNCADASVSDLYDSDGNMLPPHRLPSHVAKRVQHYEAIESFDKEGEKVITHKYKLEPKAKFLELLGKNKKMFIDKVEHSGQVGVNFNMDFGGDSE
jgi:hypothetical protein